MPNAGWPDPTTPSTPRPRPSSKTCCSKPVAAKVLSVSTRSRHPGCVTTTRCGFCVKVSKEGGRENSNSNSKTLIYKDCSLGSVKNLSNN